MTAYDPHEIADQVIQSLADHSMSADKIAYSTNRFGGKSAYISLPFIGQVRISDHSANLDFRPDIKADLSSWSVEEIIDLVQRRGAEWKAAAPARAALLAAREAAAKAEADRKAAITAMDKENRLRKIRFFQESGLENASATVQKKAWDAHKKSLEGKA